MAYSEHQGPYTLPAPVPCVEPRVVPGPNIGVIAGLVIAHAALLVVLVQANIINLEKPQARPIVVELLPDTAKPPPPPPPPELAVPLAVVPSTITAPDVIVEHAPINFAVSYIPPPPAQAVVVVPEKPPPAAATGPANAADLSSTMITADPPHYPTESRRKREQGAVLLMLLLGTDGRVADIRIARSSGFERLDKAALDAVRRWRWSPTLRGGEALQVRGVVEIPFVLKG